MSLFTEDAEVTFGGQDREVNLHTFDNAGASHVDDCASVAVPKATVPGFYVRSARGIHGNRFRRGGASLSGMSDAGRGTVEREKVARSGDRTAGDSGAMFVGDPA